MKNKVQYRPKDRSEYRKTYSNDPKNISIVMEILEKHYHYTERTTLNRMRTEKNKDPFKILISCLLSLRAKDETTERISADLFAIADTPHKILEMPIGRLEGIIYSTGHYHKKAMVLKSVSNEILARFNGIVPDNKEDLLSIKGIGPKTANIVLNFAFDKPTLPIDTHCHRIPNRLGWISTKNPEQTEKELEKILPKKYWLGFNGIFVLFGKTICTPISPFCSKCPVNRYCPRINVTSSR